MAETGGLVDGQTEHLQEQRTVNLSLHKLKRLYWFLRAIATLEFPKKRPFR